MNTEPVAAVDSTAPLVEAPGADKTVLLTLGRLPVALEIARAFHARGWRVVMAETLSWHQCRLSKAVAVSHHVISPVLDHRRFRRQLLDIIEAENVTLVVPVSEEILYVARLREQLPEGVTLLAMSPVLLDQLHDKWLFAQWAMDRQLPVPLTARGDSEQVQQLTEQHAYVIKPRLSCSGIGVVNGNRGELPAAELMNDDHVVQVQMTDTRCSSFVMSSHGRCLIIVTYQSLLDSGSVSVRFEHIPTAPSIKLFNESVVAELNFTGMISFDFMQDDQGQWQAIECNPRATSGLHFVAPQQIVSGFMAMETPALIDRIAEPFSNYASPSAITVLPPGTQRQEFWSALTETEGRLFRGKFSASLWRALFRTPDVSWSKRDWKPAVLMPFASWQLLWLAIRQRKPVSQVAMLDVGWYQPHTDPADDAERPVISVSTEKPEGFDGLVEAVTFGSDGLRYQRRNVMEQHQRFREPVFVTAHVQGDEDDMQLVGVYVLDKRQLLIHSQVRIGFYRSILAVVSDWQGKGIGLSLTDAAMTWIDGQAAALSEPVLSYGCIDSSNTRSLSLLEKQKATHVGDISLFMMYRQWPGLHTWWRRLANNATLEELPDDSVQQSLLDSSQCDCSWRDVTPSSMPRLGFADEEGTRISASVSVSEFRIVDMGFWLRWMTRLLVTPWPPARKRFNPSQFRSVVFSRIAVREGCEDDWSGFVSAVLAAHGVHFGTVYPDPKSAQFSQLLRVGVAHRWFHSESGSIRLMARMHGVDTGFESSAENSNESLNECSEESSADNSNESLNESSNESSEESSSESNAARAKPQAHALYPVDS